MCWNFFILCCFIVRPFMSLTYPCASPHFVLKWIFSSYTSLLDLNWELFLKTLCMVPSVSSSHFSQLFGLLLSTPDIVYRKFCRFEYILGLLTFVIPWSDLRWEGHNWTGLVQICAFDCQTWPRQVFGGNLLIYDYLCLCWWWWYCFLQIYYSLLPFILPVLWYWLSSISLGYYP